MAFAEIGVEETIPDFQAGIFELSGCFLRFFFPSRRSEMTSLVEYSISKV